jgi:hypothetical protein
MHISKMAMGFWSTVDMDISDLLGETSAILGSAVYISFIIAGIIAIFSSYSLGKLGSC